MKKVLFLSLMIFTTDSFASGIASNTASAPCTNNTLETYSGNSNLSADWQPNEIQLRWYNGNTLMNVQNTANTCVYDSTLTIPQNAPTRTGYTFDGWTVVPQYDFSTIPNVNGTNRWAIGLYENHDRCWYDTDTTHEQIVACDSDDNYKELQRYEWKVRYDHGTLYGMTVCSTTDGTKYQIGNPATEQGPSCWCKATRYRASNENTTKVPTQNLSFVFGHTYRGADNEATWCYNACSQYCAYMAEHLSGVRTSLFTPVQ